MHVGTLLLCVGPLFDCNVLQKSSSIAEEAAEEEEEIHYVAPVSPTSAAFRAKALKPSEVPDETVRLVSAVVRT